MFQTEAKSDRQYVIFQSLNYSYPIVDTRLSVSSSVRAYVCHAPGTSSSILYDTHFQLKHTHVGFFFINIFLKLFLLKIPLKIVFRLCFLAMQRVGTTVNVMLCL